MEVNKREPKIIDNIVYEYLGLPASGKSWQVLNDGYCKSRNAVPHSVPLGGGKKKLLNTIRGILHNFRLFLILVKIGIYSYYTNKTHFILRPFLVIFERSGRILNLKKKGHDETHIDEGVIQFIWRVFSEMDVTKINVVYLSKCISTLKSSEHKIVYVTCSKDLHIKQVIARNKISSNFDAGIVKGDNKIYFTGRLWMAYVLKNIRKNKIAITYIKNNSQKYE